VARTANADEATNAREHAASFMATPPDQVRRVLRGGCATGSVPRAYVREP
jgi:hypothetical protein